MSGQWKRFRTVYDPAAPKSERARWRPIISFIRRVCEEQSIPLKRVHVHYHPNEDDMAEDHPFGEAEYWNNVIYLCSDDTDTALHELAHVWTENWHTPKWASVYLSLCEIYMTREEFMEHVVDTAASQVVVRHALKRLYGIEVRVKRKSPKEIRPTCAEQKVPGQLRS